MFLLLQFRNATDSTSPKCFFFSTHFWAKLTNGGMGFSYDNVRRWTRKFDIFSYDLLFVPMHIGGNHWVHVVGDLRTRALEHNDSLKVLRVLESRANAQVCF